MRQLNPPYHVDRGSGLNIYIVSNECRLIEVFCVAFPSWYGTHCYLHTLVPWQKEYYDRAWASAQEIADRFNNDNRAATEAEILKAFNRTFQVNEEHYEQERRSKATRGRAVTIPVV